MVGKKLSSQSFRQGQEFGVPVLFLVILNNLSVRENYLCTSLGTMDETIPVSLLPNPSWRKSNTLVIYTNEVFQEYKTICFTDGRELNERVGFACVIYEEEVEKQLSPTDQESLRVSLLESESPFLLHHVVSGRKLHSKDFRGEQEVETLNRGAKLRINKYNHGMTTVNCAPMVRKDQQATNGIVHLIDSVLVPPPANGAPSLPEALFSDGRFRELSRMMLQSNYVNELRRGGPFTVLAPDDEAFQSISNQEMQRITGDPDARIETSTMRYLHKLYLGTFVNAPSEAPHHPSYGVPSCCDRHAQNEGSGWGTPAALLQPVWRLRGRRQSRQGPDHCSEWSHQRHLQGAHT
ncbi:UNVERIFIED_CONTAM: Transforming growth factor-beta-induced protein ig-h3 [Trichonephila clavipes]